MVLIDWQDFTKVELRVGTILEVEDFPEARNPAYRLKSLIYTRNLICWVNRSWL